MGKVTCSRRLPRCRNRIAPWPSGAEEVRIGAVVEKAVSWGGRQRRAARRLTRCNRRPAMVKSVARLLVVQSVPQRVGARGLEPRTSPPAAAPTEEDDLLGTASD